MAIAIFVSADLGFDILGDLDDKRAAHGIKDTGSGAVKAARARMFIVWGKLLPDNPFFMICMQSGLFGDDFSFCALHSRNVSMCLLLPWGHYTQRYLYLSFLCLSYTILHSGTIKRPLKMVAAQLNQCNLYQCSSLGRRRFLSLPTPCNTFQENQVPQEQFVLEHLLQWLQSKDVMTLTPLQGNTVYI